MRNKQTILKAWLVILVPVLTNYNVYAQSIDKIIRPSETSRILKTLASDEMQGRKVYSSGIDKAAGFIAAELKKAGIQPFPGLEDYYQSFAVIKTKAISAAATINDIKIDSADMICFSSRKELSVDQLSGYQVIKTDSGMNLIKEAREMLSSKLNYLVLVDSSFKSQFQRLNRLKREQLKKINNVVFVLTDLKPVSYLFQFKQEIEELPLKNVAGILVGKSKPEEYVIFSAHYDHLGTGKANSAGDSIYNGANDDASGVTAMIMLANYFSKMNNNERSIVFVAFTAEETGGFGSSYFSTQINPDKVSAMFNIEMIGTESKWGTNSAYITGFDKSDFGKILQQNLAGTDFHFEPDPYPKQNLFYRSDNATLAALGVPAHTISTSKMDEEKFYHTQEDEIETLNMVNMTAIIKAIALSSKGIIKGTETPSRVE